ncbi:coiled-coil domain-containing protein 134-like [Culicoides brevitarsis]|uniref:coiled-coil domain-containing protein 134-like n=1 Tax=Culicoides brevitarsis TaxID=469753 RepID=UPI00307CA3A7
MLSFKILLISIITLANSIDFSYGNGAKQSFKVTNKIYSNLFLRRREEHKNLLQHLTTTEKYEKRYKLIELAFQKIINGLRESKATLEDANYRPQLEFPEDQGIADALAFVLENTCLIGDLVLHFPDISYRILKGVRDWKPLFNWCINFAKKVDQIVDELSVRMLDLFYQEINEDERTPEYFNPYLEANQKKHAKAENGQKDKVKPTKTKKKIKRGPQLAGRTEL